MEKQFVRQLEVGEYLLECSIGAGVSKSIIKNIVIEAIPEPEKEDLETEEQNEASEE